MPQDSAMPQSTSAQGNGSNGSFSLFNNDEMNFMNDSLSNADKFDPFTAGMPGFKVPAVLPANLGGIGAAPRDMTQGDAGNSAPRWLNRGYGQDKNWQMQQLEALQAERQRYMASARPSDGSGMTASSSLPDFNHSQPSNSISSMSNGNGNGMSQMFPNYTSTNNVNQSEASTSAINNLSHLALQYPSSHKFQSEPREDQQANSKKQRRSRGDAPTEADDGEARRGRSPNARPPWTQPPNVNNILPGKVEKANESGSASKSKSKGSTSRNDKDDKGSVQSRLAMAVDFEAPFEHLPAPQPPPKLVDISKAEAKSSSIPDHLKEAFLSPRLPRYQPHLILLRQEQMKRKEQGLSANIRKDEKKNTSSKQREDSQDGADGVKKKGELLSDQEKKARHIFSEQKRRANIRKGYEQLCELVPALREDIDGTNSGMGLEDESVNEDGEDESTEDLKKGKRRRGQESSAGGIAISGVDKGPKSEAVILMAAVEHVRAQLEVHRGLVARKQDAQLRVAQHFGIDITSDQNTKQS